MPTVVAGISLYKKSLAPKRVLAMLVKAGIDVRCNTGPNLAINRNRCVTGSQLVRQDYFDFDYLLTLDHDVEPQRKDIERLVETAQGRNLLLLSAAYERRGHAHTHIHAGSWKQPGVIKTFLPATEGDIQQADWIGCGCCLIHADVFRRLDYPYWRSEVVQFGDRAEVTSADQGFCMALHRVGIPIMVDTRRILTHRD